MAVAIQSSCLLPRGNHSPHRQGELVSYLQYFSSFVITLFCFFIMLQGHEAESNQKFEIEIFLY